MPILLYNKVGIRKTTNKEDSTMTTERIAELQDQIKTLQAKIDGFEINPDDFEDEYEDMLDKIHGEFMGMSASYILKNTDEIAYRCGLLDFVDSIDKEDIPEYQGLLDELEELESELEGFEFDELYDSYKEGE